MLRRKEGNDYELLLPSMFIGSAYRSEQAFSSTLKEFQVWFWVLYGYEGVWSLEQLEGPEGNRRVRKADLSYLSLALFKRKKHGINCLISLLKYV